MHLQVPAFRTLKPRQVNCNSLLAACDFRPIRLFCLAGPFQSCEWLPNAQRNCRPPSFMKSRGEVASLLIETGKRDCRVGGNGCAGFFSGSDVARRESRTRWLDAVNSAVSKSESQEPQKIPQPLCFVFDGTEVLLSTSPAVPGHSILQFKGSLPISTRSYCYR